MSAVLKAKPTAVDALVRRQLLDLIEAMRIRIENDPASGQGPVLNRAQHALGAGDTTRCGELVRQVESILDRRAAEREMEAAHAAAEAQARLRGQETDRTAKGAPTRDGWLWLVRKKRLNSASRYQAGERYRLLYCRSQSDGIRSCLNDDIGGGGDGPGDAKMRALFALGAARQHIYRSVGETEGQGLVDLLDAICGRGETLTQLAGGNDRSADRLTERLAAALDMVAVQSGIVRAPR